MCNLTKKILVLLVLLFSSATYLFAWSPIFEVSRVTVSGLPSYIQSSSIEEALAIKAGDKLARIEPRTISRRLEDFTWIKSSSLSRNWTNGEISIAISTRTPVGLYGSRAIDGSGTLFDLPVEYPVSSTSQLPRVSASNPELGLRAIALFKVLPADVRRNLISLSAPNESSISTRHSVGGHELFIQWGSFTQIPLKVRVYKALLALPGNKDVKRIDLSAPHAPIAK